MLILSIKSWIIPELDFFCSLRYAGKSFSMAEFVDSFLSSILRRTTFVSTFPYSGFFLKRYGQWV